MKKALSLAIVIPVYNEQSYLADCLAAIAAQTDQPDEIIVMDNNSTDQTVAIARRYPGVRVLKERRQSVMYARTKGYDAARADIIARIDADTCLPTDWVKEVKRLMADQSVAAVTGPVSYYDGPLPRANYWLDHQIRTYLYKGAPYCPFLFGSNMAIRRTAWQSVKPLLCRDQSIHEDLDLAVHLAEAGLRVIYSKAMMAQASARRYNDSWVDFNHYMAMYRQTYRRHHIHSLAPVVATASYLAGYVLFRPYVRHYDAAKGRLSWYRVRHPNRPRKNPMH